MGLYISKCELTANGQPITDFSEFSESEIELRAQVNLMNGTGYLEKTPRYQIVVTYVPPASGTEFDWNGLKNGTFVVEYNGGRRVNFSEVCTLKVGEKSVSEAGDKPLSYQVTLGAGGRTEE